MEERTEQTSPPASGEQDERTTLGLVKDIASDTATLVRKEVELARQEIMEALSARLKAAAAFGAAGAMAFLGLVFGALAAAAALDIVVPAWAAALIVAGGFLLIAGGAALFAAARLKRPPMKPTETVRTVKEDVEWARAQLKR